MTITQLNAAASALLEAHYNDIEVTGEISRFIRHASGHWYFTLKDEKSSISATMFRGANSCVDFAPKDGLKIIGRGKLNIYSPSGSYQINITRLKLEGDGDLDAKFKALMQKLENEGLFDKARKKPLPAFPKRIGIVTSLSSAAFSDIKNRITMRGYYLAKFIAIVVGVAIILEIITILPTIASTIMNGWGQAFEFSQLLGMIKTFVASLIASSAVAALAMVIATLVKSNGATIGITVAIFIGVPTFAGFLYGIYPWFDRVYEVLPFYNSALATSIKAGNGDLLRSVVISLITISISLFAGIKIFKAQDIK